MVDPSATQEVQVTLIATGFGSGEQAGAAGLAAAAAAGAGGGLDALPAAPLPPPVVRQPAPAGGSAPLIQVPEFLRKRKPKSF